MEVIIEKPQVDNHTYANTKSHIIVSRASLTQSLGPAGNKMVILLHPSRLEFFLPAVGWKSLTL